MSRHGPSYRRRVEWAGFSDVDHHVSHHLSASYLQISLSCGISVDGQSLHINLTFNFSKFADLNLDAFLEEERLAE